VARTDFSLVIPVRNGGALLIRCIEAVMRQTAKPREIIIYDTESEDDAISRIQPLLKKIPTRIVRIQKHEFDHGGTRNAALKLTRAPWVLFLTQDAVPADQHAFKALLAAGMQKGVVAAYGRQLPHADANPLAATARGFNYPENSQVQNMDRAEKTGIKTWFTSNSFCLWNRAALIRAGGFAEKLILGEDMHAAARLIQAGGSIVYEPAAQVFHSHNYSALDEFRRYFDIGVFHANCHELLFKAGNANTEGFKFVLGQAHLLWQRNAYWSLLKLPFHIAAKLLGYKLGRNFRLLGPRFSRCLSMHKNYWVPSESAPVGIVPRKEPVSRGKI
jgi:rhamnosyltransferase